MALTKDDIIRMAEQAGMERCKCEPRCHLHTGGMGSLTYFAKLVAAAEREECAKRLDAIGCDHCATNIRLRGQ
jgi:hypothetical protein